MFLFLNTTHLKKLTTALITSQGIFKLEEKCLYNQSSEKLLPLINKLLKKTKKTLADLKGIVAVKGPGRFSAVRIGVVTANSLAYALRIPALGIKADEARSDLDYLKLKRRLAQVKVGDKVKPVYGKKPNITQARNKE